MAAVAISGTTPAAFSGKAPLPHSRHRFIVSAHRGSHLLLPENTLASTLGAIKAGVDYVEVDLRTTKDGFLVLSHDNTVDRMTDGKGKVSDLTLKQIKQLRVISPDSTDKRVYRVPEFADLLKLCKGRINIYLDFKDADVPETYRQLVAAGMEKQVVVYLNKPGQYEAWRKAAPRMPLMRSVPDSIKTPAQLRDYLSRVQIEVLDNVYDTAGLAITRQFGVAVWVDVQTREEGPALWKETMEKGVQGMQTDHPEELMRYLRSSDRK